MIKRLCPALAFLLLSMLLVAASCAPTSPPAGTGSAGAVEVTDHLGRTVAIPRNPQRIVSLSPGNTEILFAIGLADRVVGVTDYDDYPPEAKQKAKVGGYSTPDIEKIVSLAPDLIVATDIHKATVIPAIEKRGLTMVALKPESLEEVLRTIELIGKATGQAKEADRLVADMSKRIEAVRRATSRLTPAQRPKVFYIVFPDPLFTAGSRTWFEQQITIAGGVNLFSDLSGYPQVDLEVVLQKDPDIIIANTGHGSVQGVAARWASTEPRLKGTSALRTGRVYVIEENLVNRPGPRLASGVEEMLKLVHPELVGKK